MRGEGESIGEALREGSRGPWPGMGGLVGTWEREEVRKQVRAWASQPSMVIGNGNHPLLLAGGFCLFVWDEVGSAFRYFICILNLSVVHLKGCVTPAGGHINRRGQLYSDLICRALLRPGLRTEDVMFFS